MSELTPLQQVVNLIQKSEKILLLTHARADGDGLSSILALRLACEKLGKTATTATADAPGFVYQFLPAIDTVETSVAGASDLVITLPLKDRNATVSHKIKDGELKILIGSSSSEPFTSEEIKFGAGEADYDLIITCDTPELPMLGRLFEGNPDLFYEIPVINIDHHTSNTAYGHINLIDIVAASTTEILLRVIQNIETETNSKIIDADIATLLLTGLITDTGSFQHSNTTPRSLEIAADLIEMGGRQQEVINNIFKTKQLSTLKLWGRVLSKIKYDQLHRLVWSTVTTEDFKIAEGTDTDVGDIIDEVMTNAPGAEVILLLKQSSEGVSGSLRTTTPSASANDIAGIFGGGGHLQAAGFKIQNKKVDEVLTEVLTEIRAYQAQRLHILPTDDTETPADTTEVAESKESIESLSRLAEKIIATAEADKVEIKPKKSARKSLVEKVKRETKETPHKKK